MKYLLYIVVTSIFIFFSCNNLGTYSPNTKVLAKNIITTEATKRITATLQQFVDSGQIAGVSALVYEKDKEVYFGAFGFQDREAGISMDRNTLVKIYSMTKPVTGVALMTLYEQGLFELDDPVEKYAPEFANLKVSLGLDDNARMILEDSKRRMTIRDLTRHTAGFANPNNYTLKGIGPIMKEKNPMNRNNTLTEIAEILGSVPLMFQPGTRWEYGICVDVQALLVERVSGVPYKEYVRKNVLDKLGMNDTRYYIPKEDRNRLAAIYRRDDDGYLNRLADATAHSDFFTVWPLMRGGSGLSARIDDYMTFARMLVNEGSFNGVSILKPETVKLMATITSMNQSKKDLGCLLKGR
ncbi:MAG: CubicO group peptidase (beta-lactamase class C family) [Saprospiraceae bacterium]|jgi:CubicO group peptidase (beta-lactamase class C family)